jgi:hypothetical protein
LPATIDLAFKHGPGSLCSELIIEWDSISQAAIGASRPQPQRRPRPFVFCFFGPCCRPDLSAELEERNRQEKNRLERGHEADAFTEDGRPANIFAFREVRHFAFAAVNITWRFFIPRVRLPTPP